MRITDDLEAWVVFTRAPGLNPTVLEQALQRTGGAAALLRTSKSWQAHAGLSESARAYLGGDQGGITPDEARWLAADNHHLLTFQAPEFPPLLREMNGCPLALYVAGNVARLADPQIAIVGSRNPTGAGRENAFAFAQALSIQGLTITSGMAEGIDAAAHRGALAEAGPTIAILGTGIDVLYPRMHGRLAAEIEQQGALVTEFALQTPGLAANFPQRNRIIAGMTLGTLVIEAARRSGSLITARLAGEAGREVFALPGSIHNPLARGCHELLRQGAKLVENAADILSELNFSSLFTRENGAQNVPAEASGTKPAMDKAHEILLDALGFEPSDLDVLVLRTGFKPEEVSSMILILELEGHVRSAHGGRYTRIPRSPAR
jgi:DNA processing protein